MFQLLGIDCLSRAFRRKYLPGNRWFWSVNLTTFRPCNCCFANFIILLYMLYVSDMLFKKRHGSIMLDIHEISSRIKLRLYDHIILLSTGWILSTLLFEFLPHIKFSEERGPDKNCRNASGFSSDWSREYRGTRNGREIKARLWSGN